MLTVNCENVLLSAIKMSEDDNKTMLLRMYETNGVNSEVEIKFNVDISEAYMTDLNETEAGKKCRVENNTVYCSICSKSIISLKIK